LEIDAVNPNANRYIAVIEVPDDKLPDVLKGCWGIEFITLPESSFEVSRDWNIKWDLNCLLLLEYNELWHN
jgi:hypothetical protein